MWAVDNRTPYAVQRTFLRDRNGAEVWVVAVRATFDIKADGSTRLAELQHPVVEAPEYCGEAGKASLLYDSDLVVHKPTTDVILHGHAYAPKRATAVKVGMQVGPLRKVLDVWGDRYWMGGVLGKELSPPWPFDKMPLVYERAFGGKDPAGGDSDAAAVDPRNPVGTGFTLARKHPDRHRAPNVVYPHDESIPAGFGPIPREWEPRRKLAGTFDKQWEQTRFPLFPSDLDERFFQCAPEDQQARDYLAGGESVVLQNLTPDGLLRFRLPLLNLVCRTYLGDVEVEHRGKLYTVILEPDVPSVQLVWNTRLECHGKVHELTHTIVSEAT